jgi:hypothetical protein
MIFIILTKCYYIYHEIYFHSIGFRMTFLVIEGVLTVARTLKKLLLNQAVVNCCFRYNYLHECPYLTSYSKKIRFIRKETPTIIYPTPKI